MMARHGSLSEFIHSQETWTSYFERLEQYFAANDIAATATKCRAILLSSVGPPTFALIRSLVSPRAVNEVEYAEIVRKVREHFNPKPSKIMERFKFNSRIRLSGESMATFAAELRRLTEHCQFGDALEDNLLDRFVCGVNEGHIQRRLLAEQGLTFATAVQMAQAMETAERDAENLQQKPRSLEPAPPFTNATGPKPCYRCLGKHSTRDCRFKDVLCNSCGKKGHISKACLTKKRDIQSQKRPKRQRSHRANVVAEDGETSSEGEATYSSRLFRIASENSEPLYVTICVNATDGNRYRSVRFYN